MLATPGPYWLDGRHQDSRWLSTSISIAATIGLFAAAFASMKSTAAWLARAPREQPPALIPLRLPSPPAVVPPRPTRRVESPRSVPPPIVPTEIVVQPAVPVVAPSAPAVQRADTINASGAKSDATVAASAALRGAPFAPAGVTGNSRASMTAERRASLLAPRMLSIQELARQPATGSELADQQLRQRQAEALGRRVGAVGNTRDVHVTTGNGAGGTGAPVATISLPFPIFEPGPTREQRKRDEIILAEGLARLARFAAVIAARDSARADSLRRDSLAKKRVVP